MGIYNNRGINIQNTPLGFTGAEIKDDNNLYLTSTNGRQTMVGPVVGAKGDTGVGYTDATLTSDGHLDLHKSDGSTITVGPVKGDTGVGFVNATLTYENHLDLHKSDGSTITVGPVKGDKGDTGVGYTDATLKDDGNLDLHKSDGSTITVGPVKGDTGVGFVDATLTSEGHLKLNKSDGSNITVGPVKGAKGDTGVGYTNATLKDDGNLDLHKSDGSTITVGPVVGPAGPGFKHAILDANGHLVLTRTDDSTTVTLGPVKGDTGVGFVDATLKDDGYLDLHKSDDTTITVGPVVGAAGPAGSGSGSGELPLLTTTYDVETNQSYAQTAMKSRQVGASPFNVATVRQVYDPNTDRIYFIYNVANSAEENNLVNHELVKYIFSGRPAPYEIYVYKLLELQFIEQAGVRYGLVKDDYFRLIKNFTEGDPGTQLEDLQMGEIDASSNLEEAEFVVGRVFGVCDVVANNLDLTSLDSMSGVITQISDDDDTSYNILRSGNTPTVFDLNFDENKNLIFRYSESVYSLEKQQQRIVHDGYFWEEVPLLSDKKFELPRYADPDRFYDQDDKYFDDGVTRVSPIYKAQTFNYFNTQEFIKELELHGVSEPRNYITSVGIRKDIVDGYAKYGSLELWHRITDTTTLSLRQVLQMFTYDYHKDFTYYNINDIPMHFVDFLSDHNIDPYTYINTVGVKKEVLDQLRTGSTYEDISGLDLSEMTAEQKQEGFNQMLELNLTMAQRTIEDSVNQSGSQTTQAMQYDLRSHGNKRGYKILNKFSTPTLDQWPYVQPHFISGKMYFASKHISKTIGMTADPNLAIANMRLVQILKSSPYQTQEDTPDISYVIYYNVTEETDVLNSLIPEHLDNLRDITNSSGEGYKKYPVSITSITPNNTDKVYSSVITSITGITSNIHDINITSDTVYQLQSDYNIDTNETTTTHTPHPTTENDFYANYHTATITKHNLLGIVDASVADNSFMAHFGKSRFRYSHEPATLFKFELLVMEQGMSGVQSVQFKYNDLSYVASE